MTHEDLAAAEQPTCAPRAGRADPGRLLLHAQGLRLRSSSEGQFAAERVFSRPAKRQWPRRRGRSDSPRGSHGRRSGPCSVRRKTWLAKLEAATPRWWTEAILYPTHFGVDKGAYSRQRAEPDRGGSGWDDMTSGRRTIGPADEVEDHGMSPRPVEGDPGVTRRHGSPARTGTHPEPVHARSSDASPGTMRYLELAALRFAQMAWPPKLDAAPRRAGADPPVRHPHRYLPTVT